MNTVAAVFGAECVNVNIITTSVIANFSYCIFIIVIPVTINLSLGRQGSCFYVTDICSITDGRHRLKYGCLKLN
jgi:hypothetical protein